MRKPTTVEVLQEEALPVLTAPVEVGKNSGLVVVDIVKGFAEVGCGPLAPSVANPQVSQMIRETDALAKQFIARKAPVLAFLDTHKPGRSEPPYPPHCEIGTGHENFVDELAWMQADSRVTKIRKDCINGFIGAIDSEGINQFQNWVCQNRLTQLIFVGICTDICVMDCVLTTLSARNHGLLGLLEDVVVLEKGCATYDLDAFAAVRLGLPRSAIHPQGLTHHIGLYTMATRGAIIASTLAHPRSNLS
jgi:nicotinamidase-related amidase